MYELIINGDIEKALDTLKKGLNVSSNFSEGFRSQEARNAQKYRDEQEAKNIEFAKRELERRKNRGEDTFKLEQRLRAREMAFNKKTGKEDADIKKEYEDAEDKRFAENAKKSPHEAGLNPFLGEEVEETGITLSKFCCIATIIFYCSSVRPYLQNKPPFAAAQY